MLWQKRIYKQHNKTEQIFTLCTHIYKAHVFFVKYMDNKTGDLLRS